MQAADHVHRYLTLDECFLKETAKESEDGSDVLKFNLKFTCTYIYIHMHTHKHTFIR